MAIIENVFLKIVSALFLFWVVSSFQAQANLNNECSTSVQKKLIATCSTITNPKADPAAKDEAKTIDLKISRVQTPQYLMFCLDGSEKSKSGKNDKSWTNDILRDGLVDAPNTVMSLNESSEKISATTTATDKNKQFKAGSKVEDILYDKGTRVLSYLRSAGHGKEAISYQASCKAPNE